MQDYATFTSKLRVFLYETYFGEVTWNLQTLN